MPKGVCGSSTDATIALDMAEDEDRAHLTVWFQWDGTSVFPDCHGVLTQMSLRNNHDEAWQAVFDRTGTAHTGDQDIVTIDMDPHSEVTIDNTVLGTRGLADLPDLGGTFMQPKPA